MLTVLLVCRRAGVFPLFTTLIAVNILRTAVLYFTLRHGSSETYFYTFWTFGFVDLVLQLAVFYEIAGHVFRPLGTWAPDARRSFSTIAVVGIAVACLLTWLAAPPTRTLRLAIVIRGNLFSSALMGELFVAMIALSVTMGLPWRTHVARLAQGLGIYSIFGILTEAAHTYFGTGQGNQMYKMLSHIRIELYLVCLCYWGVALAIREPAPRELPEHLHEQLRVLQGRMALVLRSLRTMGSAS